MSETRKVYDEAVAKLPKMVPLAGYQTVDSTGRVIDQGITRWGYPAFRQMHHDEAKAWLLKDMGFA